MKTEAKKTQDILKLVEISKLYYERHFTQAQIAKTMKISRPLVSKLLADARAAGIVRIEIQSPIQNNAILMDQLSINYKLQGGLIVPTGFCGEKITQRVLISQAALYLERLIPSMQFIGLGWGYTMGCLVDEFKPIKNEKKG